MPREYYTSRVYRQIQERVEDFVVSRGEPTSYTEIIKYLDSLMKWTPTKQQLVRVVMRSPILDSIRYKDTTFVYLAREIQRFIYGKQDRAA